MKIMKSWVIFFIIVLVLPIVYSEEITIPETFTSDSIQITSYFYAENNLVATKKDNEFRYYSQDRLGNNRFNSDSSGLNVGEFKSLPFGEEILNTADNKFTLTGKELDSELYYFGARYYDVNTGRFTSVDPVKQNNDYAYVHNNPMYYVDLDGMAYAYVKWNHPTTGTPVNNYIVEYSAYNPFKNKWTDFMQVPAMVDGTPFIISELPLLTHWTPELGYPQEEMRMQVDMPDEVLYLKARVYGVDAWNRPGPVSDPSNAYPNDPEYSSSEIDKTTTTVEVIANAIRKGEEQNRLGLGSRVYPNPSQSGNILNIVFRSAPKGTEVDVYNLRGERVSKEPIILGAGGTGQYNIPKELASGIYFMRARPQTVGQFIVSFRPIRFTVNR